MSRTSDEQVDVGLAEVVADADEVVERLEEAEVHGEEADVEAEHLAVDEAVGDGVPPKLFARSCEQSPSAGS
jgi:hypothetical protein